MNEKEINEKDEKKINRRDVCKTLLAFGGLTLGGLAAKGQSPTPTPFKNILNDAKLTEAVKRGATMEEIAKLRDPVARTPQEALRALKTGNTRFFSGQAVRPELSAAERRAQILGQTPFAVVLGCSDSRVPIEIVFDQGLGYLFITRVAGNVVEMGTTGSIEYAVDHLKTHLVVVMGHEGCGAVKAEDSKFKNRKIQNLIWNLDTKKSARSNDICSVASCGLL